MNGDSDWNPWLDGRPSLIIVFSKLEEAFRNVPEAFSVGVCGAQWCC